MGEKYEELSLVELRELCKERGIQKISALRKSQLIEKLEQQDASGKAPAVQKAAPVSASDEKKKAAPALASDEKEKAVKSEPQMLQRPPQAALGYVKRGPVRPGVAVPARVRRPGIDGETPEGGKNPEPAKNAADTPKPNAENLNKNGIASDPKLLETMSFEERELLSQDSGQTVTGILEVMSDGFGFIRGDNYMPSENDIYVSPAQIRKYGLKSGDIICGNTKIKTPQEKFAALLYIRNVNGYSLQEIAKRPSFEKLTPIFPDERLHLEIPGASVAMRIVDLISPIGKGQRGMIVSPPKAGKTTLLKAVAKSVLKNNPSMHLIILLIDERPEEVTDIKEAIQGEQVEIIYSTFDELPEHHKRVSEMVIERAKRLVEQKNDVMILLDSITRLARAYNLTVPPSGRTLSGGLDPAALHMPKRFFGAARNIREGGSLTILATALVDTGSKMDDVVYEEFKGTGNMELVLDRKLSERRLFPAVDIVKSGTRREDLLLSPEEMEAVNFMRRSLNGLKSEEVVEQIINMFTRIGTNREIVDRIRRFRSFS